MLKDLLHRVRQDSPLVHVITNYVTVNDCANALLAIGASPIMADDKEEVEEITALAQALVLNIGTLNTRTVESMVLAGRRACKLGLPVILDPVGCGASELRRKTVRDLLAAVQFCAIRGNLSEIRALYAGNHTSRGVDADALDVIGAENRDAIADLACAAARATGAVIVISGATDVVASPEGQAAFLSNGVPMMSRVTGTGCMSSAILGAFLGANPDAPFAAAVAATAAMGVAGEVAHRRLGEMDGNASYRTYLIDALDLMTEETLLREVRYALR